MTNKAGVSKVEILWSEFGPFEKDKPTFPSLVVADIAIEEASRVQGCTYAKTGFRVTWEDGETYEGRIDVSHGNTSIAAHVCAQVAIYSGERLIPSQDRANTDALLDYLKIDRAAWRTFKETHAID